MDWRYQDKMFFNGGRRYSGLKGSARYEKIYVPKSNATAKKSSLTKVDPVKIEKEPRMVQNMSNGCDKHPSYKRKNNFNSKYRKYSYQTDFNGRMSIFLEEQPWNGNRPYYYYY